MLVINKSVSKESPVIQGTWITAVFMQRCINLYGFTIQQVMDMYEVSIWDVFECLNYTPGE